MTDTEQEFRRRVHDREVAEELHGPESRAYQEAHERMVEARDDLRHARAQAELRDLAMFGVPDHLLGLPRG